MVVLTLMYLLGLHETDSDDSKCRPCDPYIILRFRREYRVELEPTIFFREKDLSHTTSFIGQCANKKDRLSEAGFDYVCSKVFGHYKSIRG